MRTRVVEDGPAVERTIDGARTIADLTGGVLVSARQSGGRKNEVAKRVKLTEFIVAWELFPDPLREGLAWSYFESYLLANMAGALTEEAKGGQIFIGDRPVDVVLQPLKRIEARRGVQEETSGLFIALRCKCGFHSIKEVSC